MVSAIVSTPARTTHTRVRHGVAEDRLRALAITHSSKAPQPIIWMMLSTVGTYDSRAPNSPRSSTIAGSPVWVPGIGRQADHGRADQAADHRGDQRGGEGERGAAERVEQEQRAGEPQQAHAQVGPERPWSSSPSVLGGVPSRVSGASVGSTTACRHRTLPTPALPGQVHAVGGGV